MKNRNIRRIAVESRFTKCENSAFNSKDTIETDFFYTSGFYPTPI